jgi:hypothetical protein
VRPVGLVIVSADGDDWRDLIERVEHVLAPDVAGVENHIDALQCLERLRANQSMSVGNNSDQFASQFSPI